MSCASLVSFILPVVKWSFYIELKSKGKSIFELKRMSRPDSEKEHERKAESSEQKSLESKIIECTEESERIEDESSSIEERVSSEIESSEGEVKSFEDELSELFLRFNLKTTRDAQENVQNSERIVQQTDRNALKRDILARIIFLHESE
jgi:hypothetical protein